MASTQELEERMAQARLGLGTGASNSTGTGVPGDIQFSDGQGHLTPEYQDALSARMDQLGHGNPFGNENVSGPPNPSQGGMPPGLAARLAGLNLSGLQLGGNVSYAPPTGFGA